MTAEERLRQVTARLRERAASVPDVEAGGTEPSSVPVPAPDTKPASAPAPARRHWSEAGERDHDEEAAPARAALSFEAGDVSARETACQRLRTFLADGAWHSALEMVEAGGLRFGARLLELRRGLDGGVPLDIEVERRARAGRFVWFYRVAPPAAPLRPGRFA